MSLAGRKRLATEQKKQRAMTRAAGAAAEEGIRFIAWKPQRLDCEMSAVSQPAQCTSAVRGDGTGVLKMEIP